MSEARGGFTINGGLFLAILLFFVMSAFAFGFSVGYVAHAERTPTAVCRCVPPHGLNTGAAIGEVR